MTDLKTTGFQQKNKNNIMTKDLKNKLLLLKNSVEILSKPYDEQLKNYPDYVDVFDEVISDFINAFKLLPILMENNIVSYLSVYELLSCYNLIELNLSIEDRTTDHSFKEEIFWSSVREHAKTAFTLLAQDVENLN